MVEKEDLYSIVKKVFAANGLILSCLRCEKLPFDKMPFEDCLKLVFTEDVITKYRLQCEKIILSLTDMNVFKAICKNIEYVFLMSKPYATVLLCTEDHLRKFLYSTDNWTRYFKLSFSDVKKELVRC